MGRLTRSDVSREVVCSGEGALAGRALKKPLRFICFGNDSLLVRLCSNCLHVGLRYRQRSNAIVIGPRKWRKVGEARERGEELSQKCGRNSAETHNAKQRLGYRQAPPDRHPTSR